MASLRLLDLRCCRERLATIASWHQLEWQQQDLSERTRQLTTHLETEAIPTTLVALSGDCAVGSVSLVRYQRLGGYPASVWLANMYVVPELRLKGVGSRLVAGAEAEAARQGVEKLFLYTHDQENYYKKLGWHSLRQHRLAGRPATIMTRTLDEARNQKACG
ncbi:MAG: hypothetical protein Aseana_27010 [Candidatus Pelagadaptatus aseana]|uniref:GNAT family N-acetyltransferase n=1 Tax=Candidatus Pelagadaptatus aseana TaxID=3120508 RepID=UPI0039B25902